MIFVNHPVRPWGIFPNELISIINALAHFSVKGGRTHHHIAHHTQQHDDYAEEHGGCADIRWNLWQHLLSIAIVLGAWCWSGCGCCWFCGFSIRCCCCCCGCCGGVVLVVKSCGWKTMRCVVWAMAATRRATGYPSLLRRRGCCCARCCCCCCCCG